MALYDPLGQYLRNKGDSHVPMTFGQVEKIIGRKLPASAYRHRPWWANEERGHSHAKAWLRAGYETEQVDMAARKLVFRRAKRTQQNSPGSFSPGLSEPHRMFKKDETLEKKPKRSPLWGALKGTFTIEPGWDLTKPAFDPEELAHWDARLDEKADLCEKGLKRKP